MFCRQMSTALIFLFDNDMKQVKSSKSLRWEQQMFDIFYFIKNESA